MGEWMYRSTFSKRYGDLKILDHHQDSNSSLSVVQLIAGLAIPIALPQLTFVGKFCI
jgi:hypothetical protein